jgi:hypothetical protein
MNSPKRIIVYCDKIIVQNTKAKFILTGLQIKKITHSSNIEFLFLIGFINPAERTHRFKFNPEFCS